MYTIGKLAERFGLSRSALLYYDRQGLLQPSARSDANYRRYSDEDAERLAAIVRYREAGVPLDEIKKLLGGRQSGPRAQMLEAHLQRINEEMGNLRRQQQATLGLLGHKAMRGSGRSMTKEQWVGLLESVGLSDEEMMQWHREFEMRMPEAHQDFLESLSINAQEIRDIRRRSLR